MLLKWFVRPQKGGGMKLRALAVLMAMLALTVGALAAPGEATPSTDHDVSIVDFAFMPQRLAVRVGDSVTWTNNGVAPHTTTAPGRVWDSGTLQSGDTFTFTFNAGGRFQYRCQIHRQMRGLIQVRP
jgi:plastocyanin